jgi:hypothetical protein
MEEDSGRWLKLIASFREQLRVPWIVWLHVSIHISWDTETTTFLWKCQRNLIQLKMKFSHRLLSWRVYHTAFVHNLDASDVNWSAGGLQSFLRYVLIDSTQDFICEWGRVCAVAKSSAPWCSVRFVNHWIPNGNCINQKD